MADKDWRTNKDIQAAGACAKAMGADGVIVVFVKSGAYGVASYGKTGPLCNAMGKAADRIFNFVRREGVV